MTWECLVVITRACWWCPKRRRFEGSWFHRHATPSPLGRGVPSASPSCTPVAPFVLAWFVLPAPTPIPLSAQRPSKESIACINFLFFSFLSFPLYSPSILLASSRAWSGHSFGTAQTWPMPFQNCRRPLRAVWIPSWQPLNTFLMQSGLRSEWKSWESYHFMPFSSWWTKPFNVSIVASIARCFSAAATCSYRRKGSLRFKLRRAKAYCVREEQEASEDGK